jgi:hypothetical protein
LPQRRQASASCSQVCFCVWGKVYVGGREGVSWSGVPHVS